MVANQEAIRRLFRVKYDRAGNLPLLPDIFPDQLAPNERGVAGGTKADDRELVMARWGMPTPLAYRKEPLALPAR